MAIEPSIRSLARSQRAHDRHHRRSLRLRGARHALRRRLTRNDVKVVNVGYSLLPALLSHKVDAVLGVYRNVEGIQLAAAGLTRRSSRSTAPACPPTTSSSSSRTPIGCARARPTRTPSGTFVDTFVRGSAEAKAHPERSLEILSKVTASEAFLPRRLDAGDAGAARRRLPEQAGMGRFRRLDARARAAEESGPGAGCDDDPLLRVALRVVARAPARCAPRARRTHSRPRGSIRGRATPPAADRRDRPFRFPLPGR